MEGRRTRGCRGGLGDGYGRGPGAGGGGGVVRQSLTWLTNDPRQSDASQPPDKYLQMDIRERKMECNLISTQKMEIFFKKEAHF